MSGIRARYENYFFQRNQPKNQVPFPLLQTQDLATLPMPTKIIPQPRNNVFHTEAFEQGTIDYDYQKAWYQPERQMSQDQIQEEEKSWVGVL